LESGNFLLCLLFLTHGTAAKRLLVFMRESSYSFQHVLAIVILSARLSVTQVDQSKAVQAKIAKSSPSAA